MNQVGLHDTTAKERFDTAFAAHQSGRFQDAISGYESVLNERPDHPDCTHLLGLVFFQIGNPAAEHHLRRANGLAPTNAIYANSLAALLLSKEQFDNAYSVLNKLLPQAPSTYVEYFNNLGITLLGLNRPVEALHYLDHVVTQRPHFYEAYANLGRCHLMLANQVQAKAALETCLAAIPNHSKATARHIEVTRQSFGEAEALQQVERVSLARQLPVEQVLNEIGDLMRKDGLIASAVIWAELEAKVCGDRNADALLRLAEAQMQAGDHVNARKHYEAVMVLDSNNIYAANALGNYLKAEGAIELAQDMFEKTIIQHRTGMTTPVKALATLQSNLAQLFAEQGNVDAAIAHWEEALLLDPNLQLPLVPLMHLARANHDIEKQVDYAQRLLAIDLENEEALSTFSQGLASQGKTEEALIFLRNTHERTKSGIPALNIAMIYSARSEADNAEQWFNLAKMRAPNSLSVLHHFGTFLLTQRKYTQAREVLNQALILAPNFSEAHINLGEVLLELSDLELARVEFELAAKFAPKNYAVRVRSTLALPTVLSGKHDEVTSIRANIVTAIESLAAISFELHEPQLAAVNTNFLLAYHAKNDVLIQSKIATFFRSKTPQLSYAAAHTLKKRREGKIRVGFISGLLYRHTISWLNTNFIRHLDREIFEIYILRTPATKLDAISNEIDGLSNGVVRLDATLAIAKTQIEALSLDVLHYPEIGMDPFCYFLAYMRLARVQSTSWGHPVTTGIDTVDYFISSKLIEPKNAQTHYTEQLIEFDSLPCMYSHRRPNELLSRAALGLPTSVPLYGSPQTIYKLHPDFDVAIKRILTEDKIGRFVLMDGQPELYQKLKDRLKVSLGEVYDRIIWVKKMRLDAFMCLFGAVDVVLDPFHFGGGNTSYEAIGMDAPIVTLPGEFMRGRVTHGCYQTIGMQELSVKSVDEYVALSVRLANDRAYRASVRLRLAQQRSTLYDGTKPVREFERFLMAAHEAAQKNSRLTQWS